MSFIHQQHKLQQNIPSSKQYASHYMDHIDNNEIELSMTTKINGW